MITKGSTGYWATGITLRCDGKRWGGHLDFYDDGFADDDTDAGKVATEGTLRVRHMVRDGDYVSALTAVVDTLMADAARLGVQFVNPLGGMPTLYVDDEDSAPEGQRRLVAAEAARISWEGPSVEPEPTMAWVTVDKRGRLTPDSTVTIGEWTRPVPERTEGGSYSGPSRIGEAVEKHGYWPVRNAEHDTTSRPGMAGIPVEKIQED